MSWTKQNRIEQMILFCDRNKFFIQQFLFNNFKRIFSTFQLCCIGANNIGWNLLNGRDCWEVALFAKELFNFYSLQTKHCFEARQTLLSNTQQSPHYKYELKKKKTFSKNYKIYEVQSHFRQQNWLARELSYCCLFECHSAASCDSATRHWRRFWRRLWWRCGRPRPRPDSDASPRRAETGNPRPHGQFWLVNNGECNGEMGSKNATESSHLQQMHLWERNSCTSVCFYFCPLVLVFAHPTKSKKKF